MGKKILNIGTGGCGGKLLDSMYASLESYTEELTNTYDCIFINSNAREMEELKYYKGSKNSLLINGGGTGRNTDVAKQNIMDDKISFTNYFFDKVKEIDGVNIFTSCDGGFGNGSTGAIALFIRDMVPDNVSINIIGAMPKLESREWGLENACKFHVTIQKLLNSNVINSVQYINNNKMKNDVIFNKIVTDLILKSYELHGGQVDETDMLLVNSCAGYKVTLNLDDRFRKLSASVTDALNNSPFILPPFSKDENGEYAFPFECNLLGATVDKECYEKDTLLTIFPPTSLDKIDYGNDNFIVASGFDLPNYYIQLLNDKLNELRTNKKEKNTQEDFIFNNVGSERETKNENLSNKDKLKKMKNFSLWLD